MGLRQTTNYAERLPGMPLISRCSPGRRVPAGCCHGRFGEKEIEGLILPFFLRHRILTTSTADGSPVGASCGRWRGSIGGHSGAFIRLQRGGARSIVEGRRFTSTKLPRAHDAAGWVAASNHRRRYRQPAAPWPAGAQESLEPVVGLQVLPAPWLWKAQTRTMPIPVDRRILLRSRDVASTGARPGGTRQAAGLADSTADEPIDLLGMGRCFDGRRRSWAPHHMGSARQGPAPRRPAPGLFVRLTLRTALLVIHKLNCQVVN